MATQTSKVTHPLVPLAAIATIIFCALGVAVVAGWIPTSFGKSGDAASMYRADTLAQPSLDGRAGAPRQDPLRSTGNVQPAATCSECGVVQSIREVDAQGKATGVGAVGGAVLGGVLGNQVGAGRGKDLLTVAGALGGAFAGNQIEKRMKSTRRYAISVRLDNGSIRVLHETNLPKWRPGDEVKIVDGQILANF